MINLKSVIVTILFLAITSVSFGQTMIDPVEVPYFVIKRKTPKIQLPDSLGGRDVNGFAGMTITLNSKGDIKNIETRRLQISGKLNQSYQSDVDPKTDTILKYEQFLNRCILKKIKIVKTDKRTPPDSSTITFLVRF